MCVATLLCLAFCVYLFFSILPQFRGRNFKTPGACASVYSSHFSLHSLLVFNGRVSVTDELEHSPGFPYFSLAVKSWRAFRDEPINSTDVFSGRRSVARRPVLDVSPLILSVFYLAISSNPPLSLHFPTYYSSFSIFYFSFSFFTFLLASSIFLLFHPFPFYQNNPTPFPRRMS